jgi:hypothetical protein
MLEEELYAASSDELLARIRLVPDAVASVMLIGHNPSLQQLGLVLASAGDELERLEAKFPTGRSQRSLSRRPGVDWPRPTRSSRHTSFRSSFAETPPSRLSA